RRRHRRVTPSKNPRGDIIMAAITAKMVQDLREKTGAGMMDCKKALSAADGDMELAIENLRKSGAAKAEKKSGRSTNQGKVLTAVEDGKASIIEVLCETDFAAKTDKFVDMVNKFAADMLAMPGNGDISAEVQESEKAALTDAIGVIGENMQIRRAAKWEGGEKYVSYHHDGGRVSVLVEVAGEDDPVVLNDICLHIAAFRPRYIIESDVPAEVIAKEKEIAAAAGTSVSTVSRVISGHPGISTEMTATVRAEAKRLGYRVRNGRRPATGPPGLAQKTIALLALGIDRSLVSVPAVASILHGAEAALAEAGAKVQMAHIPDMTVVPPSLDLAALDGAILHGALQGNQLEVVSSRLLKRLRQAPSVWLLGRPRGGWGDAVAADDYQVGAMAAEHLAAHGHRRVAFVNPKPDHVLFMRREDGLLGAARRLRLSVQCFCTAPPGGWEFPLQAPTHVETVQHLVDQVLATEPRPTAIVAAVDSVATLIYRALAVRELRVGRDMSV
ncbi:MAG: translation elongation factor Ts, partial [Opitutae bacterium]|nr:translation elongation factor Ts [Opitutae bacterium]